MSNFNQHVISIIQEDMSRQFNSSEEEVRVIFSGLPGTILEELFKQMSPDGELLTIGQKSNSKRIPVYFLDAKIKREPVGNKSGKCTPSHLVKVRTSSGEGSFLVFQPHDQETNISIDTTSDQIGISKTVYSSNFENWYKENYLEALVEKIKSKYLDLENNETIDFFLKALEACLKRFWETDSKNINRPQLWRILKKLCDQPIERANKKTEFLKIIGIPKDSRESYDYEYLPEKIANHFLIHGFNSGSIKLRESTEGDEELNASIDGFYNHITSVCRTPNKFSSNPTQFYSPMKSEVNPDWWEILTAETWKRLLQDDGPIGVGELEVRFLNPLFQSSSSSSTFVTQNNVELELNFKDENMEGEISIGRAPGNRDFENVARINCSSERTRWEDEGELPPHDKFLRYRFESPHLSQPLTKKIIVLNHYSPKIVLDSNTASTISSFKFNNKGKDHKNKKRPQYECDVVVNGIGNHRFDFYHADGLCLEETITGYETNAEEESTETRDFIRTSTNHLTCLLETDEECYYDFKAKASGDKDFTWYRIRITAGDYVPTGISSMFQLLVTQHSDSANSGLKVEVSPSRLLDLEEWVLKNSNSYNPVVLGLGLKDKWGEPDWKNKPIISTNQMYLDPRPSVNEMQPPESFIKIREEVLTIINLKLKENDDSIEALNFSTLLAEGKFSESLELYLDEYNKWFESDRDFASWSDVITVHYSKPGTTVLEPIPDVILLSPLHPVKLAWQCNAHKILQAALNDNKHCAAASIIDPSLFPTCMVLPCKDASGRFQGQGFNAVRSTSDYWSVLFNNKLSNERVLFYQDKIFDNEFGLTVDGLSTGFNSQQVERSLDEIKRLASGKSTLRIGILSDALGNSSCNKGVEMWCSNNMGSESDEWAPAGACSLHIYDTRKITVSPEPAILASLTTKAGGNIRWFSKDIESDLEKRDLSIVDHISHMNPDYSKNKIKSAVDSTCLSRTSMRKSLNIENKFLAESKLGVFILEDAEGSNKLSTYLSQSLSLIESQCEEQLSFDSVIFSPNMETLNRAVKDSSYCAISSSSMDIAFFQQPGKSSYLWEYEIPKYGNVAGQSSGFYLLARESDNMILAIHNALKQLGFTEMPKEEEVKNLLKEISLRGMPTLKKLASGGTAGFGELGILIALRLLQTEFQNKNGNGGLEPGLLPVISKASNKVMINLIIPADIFQPRFDKLRDGLNLTGERPDLIVISITFDVDDKSMPKETAPLTMKITPIEVKSRSETLKPVKKLDALNQAKVFSEFLEKLANIANEYEIWGIGRREMLASWINYGFRVYGQIEKFIQDDKWTIYHGLALQALMAGKIDIQHDKIGRLITLESIPRGKISSFSGGKIDETITLSYTDAMGLLTERQSKVTKDIVKKVGSWDLLSSDSISTIPVQDGPPDETPANETPATPHPTIETSEPTGTASIPSQATGSSGIKFSVGSSTEAFGDGDTVYFPSNTDLTHLNMGVVGDLGNGKTQLVQSLARQITRNPENNRGISPKILILDYKRDYCDPDKPAFALKTKAKIVKPRNIPLNMFDTKGDDNPRAWLDRSRFFIDLLKKIFNVSAPVQSNHVKEAVKNSFGENGDRIPTIYDVFSEYKQLVDNRVDSAYSIMDDIVDNEFFEPDQSRVQSFDEFFDGVVIIDLNALGQDDKSKNMLVAIFLNFYYEYMARLKKTEFIGTDPQLRSIDSYLIVDEADNIMKYEFPVLMKLLLEGREFGVGVILSSQYLSHFKTRNVNYMEPLLTWFVHRVPNVTSAQLGMMGLPEVSRSVLDKIASLKKHECFCKTLGHDGEFIRGIPFFELD
tara:strand:- start:293 stop:5731 length:5439 start_codon:yes stop_codon:yes gene_type:complete